MGNIVESKYLVEEALKRLNKIQTGKLKPIKFSKPFVNEVLLGGLLPGVIIGIAGMSGSGKSYFLQGLEDDIFNEELNPDCKDYVLLRNNFEMSVFKLLMRELKQGLNTNMAEILSRPFTETEKDVVKEIYEKETNPNVYYLQNPPSPTEWFEKMKSFCEQHKDKKQIIISIDHIALIKQTSLGKKDGIDNLIESINQLRQLYNNVSFIILSQLNRNIEDRDNPRNSAPRKGDLYQSDFLFQISDVIIVVHNPYKLGLQEHMVVGRDQYHKYNNFKKDTTKNATTFLTKGNLFYHIIKMREDENGAISNLHIERLYKPKYNMDYIPDNYQQDITPVEPSADLFEDSPYD